MEQEINKFLDDNFNQEKADFDRRIVFCDSIKYHGISSTEIKQFVKQLKQTYSLDDIGMYVKVNELDYEKTLIKGLLIGTAFKNIDEKIALYNGFSYQINNWAICDMSVSNSNIKKNELTKLWTLCEELLSDRNNCFRIRFGLIFCIKYFMNDEYYQRVLEYIVNIPQIDYYVNMGISWLLSVGLVKKYDLTLEFLLNKQNINEFIYQKAFQKGIESNRISLEKKELFKLYKKNRGTVC